MSQLTLAESASFQRALYRIWLYSSVYGAKPEIADRDSDDGLLSENEDEDEDSELEGDEGDTARTKTELKCRQFLTAFKTCELAMMGEVGSLFEKVAVWAGHAGSTWFANDGHPPSSLTRNRVAELGGLQVISEAVQCSPDQGHF